MSIRTIYFDESGFTGYNLLDADQPVFAISSISLDDAHAEAILRLSFPKYRGHEFKFTNIWPRGTRRRLLIFAEQVSLIQDYAFTYVVQKRFAVLTKIVDFLIEPLFTATGYDFYSDGFCWKYCNLIYAAFRKFAPGLLDIVLETYQAFSRNPTNQTLTALEYRLRMMASNTDGIHRLILEQIRMGVRRFYDYHDLACFRGSDELQVTTMLALVAHWRQRHFEDFALVHDSSSNFFHQKELWERVTSNDVPQQMQPMGDGSLVPFPLRIASTRGIDSRTSFSIQLCDILAGLVTRHFSSLTVDEDRRFMDEVIAAGLGNLRFDGIRPGHIFPDHFPPKQRFGPDAIDQLGSIIFGPHQRKG